MTTTKKIPGYVDLQVNGFLGVDFSSSSLTKDGLIYVCKELRKRGTAAFLPTIITASQHNMLRNIELIADVIENENPYNMILGLHLEGPFIGKEKGAFGAHPRQDILGPDIDLLDRFMEVSRGHLKMMTIAANIRNADELCLSAVERGIRVSLGHQTAGYTHVRKLADAGATGLTHFGNGLPAKINRHDNPIFAGLLENRLKAMLITDGFHIPESFIRLVLEVKRAHNLIIVSDSAPAAGLPPGPYHYFGTDVELKENGKLVKSGTPYLAGSSCCMRECVEYLTNLGICKPPEIRNMAFENPLKFIGIDPNALDLEKWKAEPYEPEI
jgi:N-acetylglucosamine-6-phosphate deacetylase